MPAFKLDLYEVDPQDRQYMHTTGVDKKYLLCSGLEPALAPYLLPVIRALDMNGFDVGVLALPNTAAWLEAARPIFTDFQYHVRSDFIAKQTHFLRQPAREILRPRNRAVKKPGSWFSRHWGGYDYYSDPYVQKNISGHIFRGILNQCGIHSVPESILDPIPHNVAEEDRAIDTLRWDSRSFATVGDEILSIPTEEDVREGVGVRMFSGPISFMTTLRTILDRDTAVYDPAKNFPRLDVFSPDGFQDLDLGNMIMRLS